MAEKSSTLCTLPWTHLFVDEKGEFFPCCMSHTKPVRGTDGKALNISQSQSIEKAWNSNDMKTLRSEMLQGRKPSICENCWKGEALGMKSYRQISNEMYSEVYKRVEREAPSDGSASLDFRFIDIRLGNYCNLRCRMCAPWSSRLWNKEWVGLYPEKAAYTFLEYDWFKNPDIFERLVEYSPHLEALHFAGGEPLIVREGLEFLKKLVAAGRAGGIRVTYNTNLTVIPEGAFDVWRNFKSVGIIVSLDGVGDLHEYIRYPSKWDAIDRNMKLLDEHARDPRFYATVHTTVQAYNILRLHELFEYLEPFKHISHYPRMDLVLGRPALDAQVLPRSLKALARERAQAYLNSHSELPEEFVSNLKSMLDHMDAIHRDTEYSEFLRITDYLDRQRDQKFLSVLPEFAASTRNPFTFAQVQARKAVKAGRRLAKSLRLRQGYRSSRTR